VLVFNSIIVQLVLDAMRLFVGTPSTLTLPRLGSLLHDAFRSALLCCVLAIVVASCGAQTNRPQTSDAAPPSAVSVMRNDPLTAGDGNESEDRASAKQLAALTRQRLHDHFDTDYPVGPGDVLEVSVPDMPELRSRMARVSGVNTISLPILGELYVAGLNQNQVKSSIRDRLTRYLHDPQVDVFVREYHSREVAVMGMVQKPGIYTLDSPDETVLDVIGKAGGSTERAANKVILIPSGVPARSAQVSGQSGYDEDVAPSPDTLFGVDASANRDAQAEKVRPEQPIRIASTGDNVGRPKPDSYNNVVTRHHGIVMDLSGTSNPALLALPARPGDLMIVPAAGEVMVQGWVRNAGAFNITPGMTALGAITAAGGEMFSSSVDVLRTEEGHRQVDYPLDLSKIKKHEEEDVFVQSGDVVIVNKTAAGALPYLGYSIFNKLNAGFYGTSF
jgi:protein involved in polysaccharide export with SLBB domain